MFSGVPLLAVKLDGVLCSVLSCRPWSRVSHSHFTSERRAWHVAFLHSTVVISPFFFHFCSIFFNSHFCRIQPVSVQVSSVWCSFEQKSHREDESQRARSCIAIEPQIRIQNIIISNVLFRNSFYSLIISNCLRCTLGWAWARVRVGGATLCDVRIRIYLSSCSHFA